MLKTKNRKKIAFVCPYPVGSAPGQRFRYELFFEDIGKKYNYKIFPFLDEKTNAILYENGKSLRKIAGVCKGFFRRILDSFYIVQCDFIFIFRECAPLGPPIFEFIYAKIFKKRLIYDFDDAIWLSDDSLGNPLISKLKCPSKVPLICKWSYKISCGNAYLAEYAMKLNSNVYIIPTVVDTEKRHRFVKEHTEKQPIIIGWTGSHSTIKYLNLIEPVIQVLEKTNNIQFLVIADKNPALSLLSFKFLKWRETTEIEDLMQIDIGVMPLNDSPWEWGKCGFKAIQYMSLGVPAIVSPIGVNKEIVDDKINGFICSTQEEWKDSLLELINNAVLRKKMGFLAREKIIRRFSVSSVRNDFLLLFSEY